MIKGLKITSKIQPRLKYENEQIAAITFTNKNEMTKEQVIKEIETFKKRFDNKNYNMMVCVETEIGPRSGKVFSNKSRVLLCDDYEWNTTYSFTLYVWKEPPKKGGCDNENNDCLFDCIQKVVSTYRLPKGFNKPDSLKKELGLDRDDMISIDLIPSAEKLLKININITGDYIYTSPKLFPTKSVVNIILQDGHYYLDEDKITTGEFGVGLTKREFTLVLCQELDKNVLNYDGEKHIIVVMKNT